jgi:hypothetical protein
MRADAMNVVIPLAVLAAIVVLLVLRFRARGRRFLQSALYLHHLQATLDSPPDAEPPTITEAQARLAYRRAMDDFYAMSRDPQRHATAMQAIHDQLMAYRNDKPLLLTRARQHGFPG